MNDELVMYYNPQSRARITHWMLEEVGAPYRLELVSLERKEHKTDRYLAINPMGKLPALVHRDVVVTEAPAICAYLADAFPTAGLAPAVDDPARGTYYRWLFFGASCLEYATVDKMFARAPVDRPGAIGYGTYEDTVRTLELALSRGPYILGERFSAADVYIGSQIGFNLMMKGLEPRPAFVDYQARLVERPAFKRVLAQTPGFADQLKGTISGA